MDSEAGLRHVGWQGSEVSGGSCLHTGSPQEQCACGSLVQCIITPSLSKVALDDTVLSLSATRNVEIKGTQALTQRRESAQGQLSMFQSLLCRPRHLETIEEGLTKALELSLEGPWN